MKISEVIVPQLQGLKLNNKCIEKAIVDKHVIHNKYNFTLLCSEDGFYKYKNDSIMELCKTVHNSYCMKKKYRMRSECNNTNDDEIDHNDHKETYYEIVPYNNTENGLIFINEITNYEIPTNTIPYTHSKLQYCKNVIKINKKSNLELIFEEYNDDMIKNKVYFYILNDFSINSDIIKNELNDLISFLQE